MFSLLADFNQVLSNSFVTMAAETAAGWSFDDLSQPMMVFIMAGLTILLPTISGAVIYHSLNMPHAQHGHDDH